MDVQLQWMLDNWDAALTVLRSESIWVNVKPEAKQSVRGGGGSFHTSPKKKKYLARLADEIGIAWGSREPLDGMVRVTVLYAFPWRNDDKAVREAFTWALMHVRPDVDNLFKPLADSLAKHCFADDGQVVEVRARKMRFATDCIAVKPELVEENREILVS